MKLNQISAWMGHLGNVISALTAPWLLGISILLGAVSFIWDSFADLAGDSRIQIVAGVFISALWSLIGIKWLFREGRPLRVRIDHDLPYSLIFEQLQPIWNQESQFPLAMNFVFRNVGSVPIKVRLDEIDFIIDDRILPDSPRPGDLVLARLAQRGIQTPGFKKEAFPGSIKGQINGKIRLKVLYGYLNEDTTEAKFQRKLEVNIDLFLELQNEGKTLSFLGNIINEKESAVLQNK